MKPNLYIGLFIMSLITSSAACGAPGTAKRAPNSLQPSQSLEALFARPLIAGASVSADWSTTSPSRRASLRFTKPSSVVTIARGGTPGVETVPRLTEDKLADRSILLAMDLFFWDSTNPSPSRALVALDSILARAKRLGVPVILGDIPELLSGRQPSRQRLNEAIYDRCRSQEGCYVWKLTEIHERVVRDGSLTIKGKRYRLEELVPDGLHLSEVASEFLTDELQALASRIVDKP